MKIKRPKRDMILLAISYFIMIIAAAIILIPFMNIIAKCFSDNNAVVSGKVGIWPVGFQLDTITYVFSQPRFLQAGGLSVLVTVLGTVIGIVITGMTAYPLSKKNLPGIKAILVLFVFTMLFNGGIIPTYLLMKQMKLLNTFWVLLLPLMLSVYNMLIIKNYYESIPESIEESAKIDGASNFYTFVKIIVPLSVPVYATIILFIAVAYWNDYFNPMMYITKSSLKTLQLYLRDIIAEASDSLDSNREDSWMNMSTEGMRSATILASIIPVLCVYPFVQKYFIKGIMIGSVKG